ncbi:MAG TPA: O-antigen ligase family protein [Verrucomicrobiae bacterium]|nr:O-antigen ligase family protein [Verrucomicrobiae bacterium]
MPRPSAGAPVPSWSGVADRPSWAALPAGAPAWAATPPAWAAPSPAWTAARRVVAAAPGGVVPFVALVSFTFVMLLAPQAFLPFLAPLRPAMLAAAIALGVHAGGNMMSGRPVTIVTREVILLALLGAWAVATLPFSLWPGGSVTLLTGIYFKSFALFGLNANLVTTARRLRALAWLFALAGIPLAMTALNHAATGQLMGNDYEAVKRIAGYEAPLTANPNDLALTLNLLLPFAAALAIWSRRPAVKLFLWGVVAFDAVGVVLTYSRGGFLTLMTLGLLLAWHRLRGNTWAMLLLGPAAAAGALVLFLAPPSYLRHMETITNYQADPTGSAQNRLSDMITSVKIAVRHPFIGAGLGMNGLALNEARSRPAWKMVHDVYLQYAVDLGLLGLGIFLALYSSSLQSARRAVHGAHGPPGSEEHFVQECSRAILFALIAFGVAAIFHPVAYHFYFFGMAGLAVAAARVSQGSPNAAS